MLATEDPGGQPVAQLASRRPQAGPYKAEEVLGVLAVGDPQRVPGARDAEVEGQAVQGVDAVGDPHQARAPGQDHGPPARAAPCGTRAQGQVQYHRLATAAGGAAPRRADLDGPCGTGAVALPPPAAPAEVARPGSVGAPGAAGAEHPAPHHVRGARAGRAHHPRVEARHRIEDR